MASNNTIVSTTPGALRACVIALVGAALLAVAVPPSVSAQSAEKWTYTLGFGIGTAPDYEGGDDYEAVPIPVARAQNGHRYASLFGLEATSNFIDHPVWRLGPTVKYQPGYSSVDNDRVDSLNNRGGVWLGGAKGGYVMSFQDDSSLELGMQVLYGGNRGGFLYTPSAEYNRTIFQKYHFTAILDTTYASGAYMSHFFSINRDDSLGTGLDEEDADASFKDVGLTASVARTFADHWTVSLIGQYKRMVGDAEDSPVVDDEGDENQGFGALVVSYTF